FQYTTRDQYGYAIKSTWAKVDGKEHNLFKSPITDDGTKKSLTGRLAVLKEKHSYKIIERATPEDEKNSMLKPIWKDGHFIKRFSFQDIRDRLALTHILVR